MKCYQDSAVRRGLSGYLEMKILLDGPMLDKLTQGLSIRKVTVTLNALDYVSLYYY